jgi:hypothetical protein
MLEESSTKNEHNPSTGSKKFITPIFLARQENLITECDLFFLRDLADVGVAKLQRSLGRNRASGKAILAA